MPDTYTINNIIEIYSELGVSKVSGNIIFPSDPSNIIVPEAPLPEDEATNVANAAGFFARRIGLVYPDSWHEGKDIELETCFDLGVGEHFMRFKTLERFEEIMGLFPRHNQLPPYFLMGIVSKTNSNADFQALDKNAPEYKYECISNLDMIRKRLNDIEKTE